MDRREKLAAFEAYAMYLLTGAECIMLGSSMSFLTRHFSCSMAGVAMLGSAFGLGRVLTVFLMGWLTERLGVRKVLSGGIVLVFCFLAGIPLSRSYTVAMIACILGGIGMGTQDTTCPVILANTFPSKYASAMSAGQACFGAGCFLPPLTMSLVLTAGLPFYATYYIFASAAVVMLILLPFASMPGSCSLPDDGENRVRLRVRSKPLAYFFFALVCISYCAVMNTVNLYAAGYAESLNAAASVAVLVLTAYNVGSMTGSVIFIGILRHAKPVNILCINSAVSMLCLAVFVSASGLPALFVSVFFAGVFMGVIFSLLITISTGMNPEHASFAGALVAVLCGGTESLTPIITGNMATNLGIHSVFVFALVMIIISAAAALAFRFVCRNKKDNQSFREV